MAIAGGCGRKAPAHPGSDPRQRPCDRGADYGGAGGPCVPASDGRVVGRRCAARRQVRLRVEAGSRVSLYYDSLIAKLIAHGGGRADALYRLVTGLSDLTLLGVPTTQAFLRDAARHPLFDSGKATTRFIETAFPEGWKPSSDELLQLRAAACVVWAQLGATEEAHNWINPWDRRSAVRVTSAVRPAKVSLHMADEYGEVDAEIRVSRAGIAVELEGISVDFELPKEGDTVTLAP